MVAPQLATVTASHRVIDFFVATRDVAGACEATTQISSTSGPSEFHAADTTQEVGDGQVEALASGEAQWMQEARD